MKKLCGVFLVAGLLLFSSCTERTEPKTTERPTTQPVNQSTDTSNTTTEPIRRNNIVDVSSHKTPVLSIPGVTTIDKITPLERRIISGVKKSLVDIYLEGSKPEEQQPLICCECRSEEFRYQQHINALKEKAEKCEGPYAQSEKQSVLSERYRIQPSRPTSSTGCLHSKTFADNLALKYFRNPSLISELPELTNVAVNFTQVVERLKKNESLDPDYYITSFTETQSEQEKMLTSEPGYAEVFKQALEKQKKNDSWREHLALVEEKQKISESSKPDIRVVCSILRIIINKQNCR